MLLSGFKSCSLSRDCGVSPSEVTHKVRSLPLSRVGTTFPSGPKAFLTQPPSGEAVRARRGEVT